jgi:hypothetical protein
LSHETDTTRSLQVVLERSDSAATRTLFQEGRRNGKFVGEADTRKAAARIFGKIAADYEGNYPDRRRYSTEGAGWVITGVRSPAQLRKERKRHSLQVPVPSVWYGKLWSYTMTCEEAQKALESEETKQAVALMKEIDKQREIDAELTSGIYDTPGGASVVIVHDIKTSLDWETLRYLAAIKGKALLEKSPDQLLT